MNSRVKQSMSLSSIIIAAVMVGFYALVVGADAQSSNVTSPSLLTTNQSQGAGGLMPEAALQSVLEQTRSANATEFAIGNIINQSGLSNASQPGSANETMNSVIEEAKNTNATSFAADRVINQTLG